MSAIRNLLMKMAAIFKPKIEASSNNVWVRDGQISEVQIFSNTAWIIR